MGIAPRQLRALTHAHAIGIGLCDGLIAAGRAEALYNAKSQIYTQALAEMKACVRHAGGRAETVTGLAGAGDLHVTGAAGRNRIFGELRGSGLPTREVVKQLRARDQLTEGYAAIRWCWRFAEERRIAAPLLRALHRIAYGDHDVETELRAACWPGLTRRVDREKARRGVRAEIGRATDRRG